MSAEKRQKKHIGVKTSAKSPKRKPEPFGRFQWLGSLCSMKKRNSTPIKQIPQTDLGDLFYKLW